MSEYIVRMPSDIPYEIRAELNAWYVESEPIVRCKDCVWFDPDYYLGKWCINLGFSLQEQTDGFCAWGERKADGETQQRERETR